ncbi:MAG: glycosyltransferase family 2 protein, partial [Kiritimatiellae bacterium]|nr:glycosyltransferase family 2 protein [Kiritimatiellia bacterium]
IVRHGTGEERWFEGGQVNREAYESHHCSLETFRSLPMTSRYISGCAMLIRRDTANRVGRFDERYFMYCEDADYCLRAARAGFAMEIVEDAVITHKVSQSTGTEPDEATPFRAYHILRSHLLFWRNLLGCSEFHRGYCRSQLGRWVLSPLYRTSEGELSEWGAAVVDAFWYYLSGCRHQGSRRSAPRWFRAWMTAKPWMITEGMGWRWPA